MPDPKIQQQQPAFPSIPGITDPARMEADRISQGNAATPSSTTNSPPPAIARLYNSLDGGEIIKMLTQQISAMLRRDQRLATNITFPRAMWHCKIDLVVQGREDPHVLFDLSGGHIELDTVTNEEYPQDPSREIRISTSGGQSYVDTPDDIREEHGIDPPVARRHRYGSAETLTDRSQRVADSPPEYQEGKKAIEAMQKSDPMKARRLAEALEGRPHVIVEDSPMAKQSRVLSSYDSVEERPSRSAESPYPQELRGSRLREDAIDPRSSVPDDPRFKLEGMKPILDAEGRVISKDQEDSPSPEMDLRERAPARSGSIKDAEGRTRGDMVAKAQAQEDRGAPPLNKEVKMQPDSVEAENPDAVSSRQGTPEVDTLDLAVDESAEVIKEEMILQSPAGGEGEDASPNPVEPPSKRGKKK